MRELKEGVSIPAQGSDGLAPGSYHLMLTHFTHPRTKGDSVKATLNSQHAARSKSSSRGRALDGGTGGVNKGLPDCAVNQG